MWFNSLALVAELSEGDGLLGRQIDDDEAIDTRSLAIFEESLLTVAEEGVVVTHEQDRSLQTAVSGRLDHAEGGLDRDAIVKSNLHQVNSRPLMFPSLVRTVLAV